MTELRHRVNIYMSISFAVLTFPFVFSEQWALFPSYYINIFTIYHITIIMALSPLATGNFEKYVILLFLEDL